MKGESEVLWFGVDIVEKNILKAKRWNLWDFILYKAFHLFGFALLLCSEAAKKHIELQCLEALHCPYFSQKISAQPCLRKRWEPPGSWESVCCAVRQEPLRDDQLHRRPAAFGPSWEAWFLEESGDAGDPWQGGGVLWKTFLLDPVERNGFESKLTGSGRRRHLYVPMGGEELVEGTARRNFTQLPARKVRFWTPKAFEDIL